MIAYLTTVTADTDDGAVFVPDGLAGRIAEQLATVARAGCRLAAEADQILSSGATVSEHTVGRLESLLVELRATVQVRAELAAADPDLLLAGARLLCRPRPVATTPRTRVVGGHVWTERR
jgi:hypothetical protein